MKLEHVYNEAFQTSRKTVIGNNPLTHGDQPVRDIPNSDPHLSTRISDNDEIYNRYTKFLFNNKLAQQNPHFPRIYEEKTLISTDKNETHPKKVFTMSATPMTFRNFILFENNNEQSLERIKQIANMYLNDSVASNYNQVKLENNRSLDRNRVKQLEQELISDLSDVANISLETYKEALMILIDASHVGRLNLTDENIKVRRSPYGAQLVFDKPFQ
jgi:hypothetical protein